MLPPAAFLHRITRALPLLLAAAAVVACVLMIDLKGISTDEGIRLNIINGGKPAAVHPGPPWATWSEVYAAVRPQAYQPAYYFLQNSLMRVTGRQDVVLFRYTNIGFLALCLVGLLVLSRTWATWPRCFLIGLFAFNAYLIMHVLQIREYLAGLAFYIWSTWLVLRLDRRALAREWADFAWFASYGLMLAAGFYLQTWTAFPAAAQGLFLALRRRPQAGRFLAHLAVSHLVAFSLIWPYLQENQQKINVGLWAHEKVTLLGQLHQGFHLVLGGQTPGHDRLSALLPWAWLGLLLIGGWLGLRRLPPPSPEIADDRRQAWLMGASILLPLAFQIIYYFKVEPLSVWPRYFIIHYFFLTWLIALAFRALHRASLQPGARWPARMGLAGATVLLAISAVHQVGSYRLDPYFDTSLSRSSDWRVGSRLLARVLAPDDVVLCQDFVTRSTLAFTHPLPNRLVTFKELPDVKPETISRLVYLEPSHLRSARAELIAHLTTCGYSKVIELTVPGNDPLANPPSWCVVAFSRP